MKILKRPANIVYDTENPDELTYGQETHVPNLTPLHHVINQTDDEFLRDHFEENHPIFNDFGSSYFYVV